MDWCLRSPSLLYSKGPITWSLDQNTARASRDAGVCVQEDQLPSLLSLCSRSPLYMYRSSTRLSLEITIQLYLMPRTRPPAYISTLHGRRRPFADRPRRHNSRSSTYKENDRSAEILPVSNPYGTYRYPHTLARSSILPRTSSLPA
jgi:hypothetical protein